MTMLALIALPTGASTAAVEPPSAEALAGLLVPRPRVVEARPGRLRLHGLSLRVAAPAGAEHEACRIVVRDALSIAGARTRTAVLRAAGAHRFMIGPEPPDVPPLPETPHRRDAYALAIGPGGIAAQAAGPAGLLHAAQTLRQIARVCAEAGAIPSLALRDAPELAWRGIYIEGGQERFGRIVDAAYLRAQIQRLSEYRMNALVIECYNLFPFPSFPQCADEGTLTEEECRAVFAEAKRWHVTLIPSLQTLAQSWELVWNSEAGVPYREPTAPGQMCPSNPDVYPFVKGLYRDLLRRFGETPLLGVGCSEIDMQWQGRYCPRCAARVKAGETVRDLLIGHATRCIAAVNELARETGRNLRPMMWADEFTHYGPGHDWVGIERIPRDTVMGYWKYWPDYAPIAGLMERGHDVLGVSAIYNHTFYLADLSPGDPPKSWPSMEQTGVRNIAGLAAEGAFCNDRVRDARFMGVVTASFSKHRLRAFDTLWYGFALNAECAWNRAPDPIDARLPAFTRAFVWHHHDARTSAAARALAEAWEALDARKSRLELANQTLGDVVGVVDTQEAGYIGNTLGGALRKVRDLLRTEPDGSRKLDSLRQSAQEVERDVSVVERELDALAPAVGRRPELDDLRHAAAKIRLHAQREVLMIDLQQWLAAQDEPAERACAVAREHLRNWWYHRAAWEQVARRDARLSRRGDPCGHQAVLAGIDAVVAHLRWLARPTGAPRPESPPLLSERFERLDPERWIVFGEPKLADGWMETFAPGGWENRSGIATRRELAILAREPLVVEFTLAPVRMGIDSQICASADASGIDSFRFAFYGQGNRFFVHTRSATPLRGPWLDPTAGWKQRASSPPVQPGAAYRVRAEVRRTSVRFVVRAEGDGPRDLPFWDTCRVPMDELASTRLRFADAEPDGRTGSTRWRDLVIRGRRR